MNLISYSSKTRYEAEVDTRILIPQELVNGTVSSAYCLRSRNTDASALVKQADIKQY